MFAIKVALTDPDAAVFSFARQKTMYGGKRIAPGDTLFIFASESAGGAGLVARALVTAAHPVPPLPGVPRQTPRVDVTATRIALARRRLGRAELKAHATWDDGEPATELNFKFYRQATEKIVGLTPAAAEFLLGFFEPAEQSSGVSDGRGSSHRASRGQGRRHSRRATSRVPRECRRRPQP